MLIEQCVCLLLVLLVVLLPGVLRVKLSFEDVLLRSGWRKEVSRTVRSAGGRIGHCDGQVSELLQGPRYVCSGFVVRLYIVADFFGVLGELGRVLRRARLVDVFFKPRCGRLVFAPGGRVMSELLPSAHSPLPVFRKLLVLLAGLPHGTGVFRNGVFVSF